VRVMSIPKPVDCAVTDAIFAFLFFDGGLVRGCDFTARVVSMPQPVQVDVTDGHLRACFLVLFLL